MESYRQKLIKFIKENSTFYFNADIEKLSDVHLELIKKQVELEKKVEAINRGEAVKPEAPYK